MKLILLPCMILSIVAMALSGCGQSSSIVKRWQAAGRLENGNIVPHRNEIQEYEFLKDGTFNFYIDGSIKESGTYVMAGDKKSFLLKDEGRRNQTITIVKLTANELDIIPERNDTIICYVSGSSLSEKARKKAENYSALQKHWYSLETEYQRRYDLLSNLIMTAKYNPDAGIDTDNEIFARMEAARNEISTIRINTIPSKEEFEKYETLQAKYSRVIADFLELLKRDSKIVESQIYKDFTTQLSGVEKKIEESKADFIASFNAYHEKKVLALP